MKDFPASLKIITVWLLIGLAVFLGIQAFESDRQRTRFEVRGGQVVIQRGPDGHYHWPGTVNGVAVDFLVDTGATSTAVSTSLARELDLPTLGSVQSETAGGRVTGDIVQADIVLDGGVRVQRLRIVSLPQMGDRPLLGMDVLGRLQWQQRQGVLTVDLGGDGP